MYKIPILLSLALFPSPAPAQEATGKESPHARWESAIAAFEKKDKASPPKQDGFLFVGSSSIRMWKLDKSFPELGAINRGFGGSEIENSTHFAERIIFPYRPHTVLLYAGDNDVAKGKDAARVEADFKKFVAKVHEGLPDAQIAFIAIKPSLSRWDMWPVMSDANKRIATICAENPKLTYLDIAAPTLGKDGKPDPAQFLDDGLHLNADGYAAWKTVVGPFVERRLAEIASESTKNK